MNSIRKARGAAPCRSRRVHRRFGEIRGSGPPTAPSRSRLGFARRVLAGNTEPRPPGSGRLERKSPSRLCTAAPPSLANHAKLDSLGIRLIRLAIPAILAIALTAGAANAERGQLDASPTLF